MADDNIFSHLGRLYLICDGESCESAGISRESFITAALKGGVRLFQYRHKNISAAQYRANLVLLATLCADAGAILIVNDHAAIAEELSLPLHLGQADALIENLTVPYGRSTHSLAELAVALSSKPRPAYLALGAMFASRTKPDIQPAQALVTEFLNATQLPLVLIGGITLENVAALPRAERICYAVIKDAFRFGATEDGIKNYARQFSEITRLSA